MLGIRRKIRTDIAVSKFIDWCKDKSQETSEAWLSLFLEELEQVCQTKPYLDDKLKMKLHINYFAAVVACQMMAINNLYQEDRAKTIIDCIYAKLDSDSKYTLECVHNIYELIVSELKYASPDVYTALPQNVIVRVMLYVCGFKENNSITRHPMLLLNCGMAFLVVCGEGWWKSLSEKYRLN